MELCSPRKTTDECTCFLTGPRWRFIVVVWMREGPEKRNPDPKAQIK